MSTVLLRGPHGRQLATEEIYALADQLASWRANPEIQIIQKSIPKKCVFDFVKGLRFSARLIYIIRQNLLRYRLEVDWGQVLYDDGAYLSPECDIIIHKGYFRRWNGNGVTGSHVMDFKFINYSEVIAVISCKSKLSSITKDLKDYSKRIKPSLKRKKLWLFAECIPKGKSKKINQDSQAAGYQRCWYLYEWDNNNSIYKRNEKLLISFIEEIINLGDKQSRKGHR